MLLGIVIGLLIAAVIVLTYLLVKKPKVEQIEEDEQEKKLNEHWDKILNYSVAQAYGGE